MKDKRQYATDFFIRLMEHCGIFADIISSPEDYTQNPHATAMAYTYCKTPEEAYDYLKQHTKPHVLYHEINPFQCHYYGIVLMHRSDMPLLLIGPVRAHKITDNQVLEILESLNLSASSKTLLQLQYDSLTKEHDLNMVESLVYGFCEEFFGGANLYTQENHSLIPDDYMGSPVDLLSETLSSDSQSVVPNISIDDLYALENQMLDCIRTGNAKKVDSIFQATDAQSAFTNMERRTPDTIRNFKNQCIILNTLCRKTAERSGVPLIYVHQVSNDFAHQIERITSVEESVDLTRYMVRKYALLVQNRSINEYSKPVQRIITMVDTDLTADLSLQHFAQELNQNASYLSTLFKKETGEALTDYVNSKRIEHALLLLNTTNLQIQTIANSCGIYDLSYFGKLFKKYVNMSPSAYRNSIR